MDVVFGPNCSICETDLASDGALSARLAQRPNGRGYPISVLESEIRVTAREGRNLATRSKDSEGLLCDILNVYLPRRLSLCGNQFA
jgi:hypothetical protein